jgi:hypothetical protein
MDAAVRDLEYEARQKHLPEDRQKCPVKRGVFEGAASPMHLNGPA